MRRSRPFPLLPLALACLAGALAASAPARADLPPEGECPVLGGQGPLVEGGEDVAPVALREGMLIGLDHLLALAELLPKEVWNHREAFFYEGMRLEVGWCHRRYPVPPAYSQATLRHWENVSLDDDGNLRGYRAGLPFPPDRIDPEAGDAGTRWAWNLELRYRGAGPAGRFLITDMPSRVGSVERYIGSFFQLQTRHRADLPETDYTVPEGENNLWVAGGRFEEPFHARHLAWRQMRPVETLTRYKESDRTWVYVPDMRKPKRAVTTWVDGVYTPRYSAAQQLAAGGGVPYAADEGIGGLRSIAPTASWSTMATAHLRRGFVGLSIRPNAYRWTLRGERDVIAPLNGSVVGWPIDPERNYGPSGLSVATDRWDVRRAVVLHGVAHRSDENVGQVVIYVDYQTQQPLYYVARQRNGLLIDVGIFVHRFSGDLARYPRWPDGSRALVFDPVATVFYAAADGGTGWRRESYDVHSVPPEGEDRRRMTSVAELERGR